MSGWLTLSSGQPKLITFAMRFIEYLPNM